VGEARGVGLVGALELAQDRAARRAFDPATGVVARVQSSALEGGLMVRGIRECVAVCPPLIVDEAQVDELFDKLGVALDVTLGEARQRGLVA
jgi:4-aminobutyrate---pyruvate transaminase